MQERRRAQANGGGAGAEEANGAASTVRQFTVDVRPIRVNITVPQPEPEPELDGGHRRAQANSF